MKQRATIGVEISPGEVRAALVRQSGGTAQLVGVSAETFPADWVSSDGLADAQQVGEAVRRACAKLDPKASHIVMGMTGCSLVARVMEIPPVPDSDIRAVLRGEMDHFRILPSGQSAFDYFRLPNMPEAENAEHEEPTARVLLIGAEEKLVSSYRAVIDASGLNLSAIEPGSIAVIRALFPLLKSESSVATVAVSNSGTDVFITHEGVLLFFRRMDSGLNELKNHASTNEGPAQGKVVRGGPLVLDDVEEAGLLAAGPAVPVETEAFNRQAISLLMTEVQRSIDYYLREFPHGGDKIFVRFAIDAPEASELFSVMSQYLRSDAELASFVDSVAVMNDAAEAVQGPHGFRFTVAVGLALRTVPGVFAEAPRLDLSVGDNLVVERRAAPKLMFASVAASGLVFLGTMAAAIVVGHSIAGANRQLSQQKAELTALTQEHATKVAQLARQKTLVDAIHFRDKPMREAIEFLSAAVSRRACFTALAIEQDGKIVVSGEATSPRVVADIMDTINLSPMLHAVRLNALTRLDASQGANGLKFDLETGLAPVSLMPVVQAALPVGEARGTGGKKPAGGG